MPLELVVFDAAGKSVEAVTAEQADIGFFAVDPLRGQGIRFTAPYVLIVIRAAFPDLPPSLALEPAALLEPNYRLSKGTAAGCPPS